MNVGQSDAGPNYADTVYNTMKGTYDKDDSTQVEMLRAQLEAAEEFILSFMRTPRHRELMQKLLQQNMKAARTGRKGKEKGRPLTEKEALSKITDIYRKTIIK